MSLLRADRTNYLNPEQETVMSKKIKTVFALGEDFKVMIALVPKLEAFIKGHREIAAGYQKYRKSGGAAIPGVEKYLGVKQISSVADAKADETAKPKKIKTPKDVDVAKKKQS
jgi:hypothetical protein